VIHNDGALLIVDLGIYTSITDQIDDPFLAFAWCEVETGREIPCSTLVSHILKLCEGECLLDVYPLVNLAVCLRD
jgi:hypothetical protein